MPPRAKTEKASSKLEANLYSERKLAAIGASFAVLLLPLLVYAYNTYLTRFIPIPHLHSLTDRIVFTLRYQTIGLFCVIWSVMEVSLTRAFTPAINPFTNNDAIVEKANRILVNTNQQFVISAINQLIIATYLSEDKLRLIPLLSALFLLGRVAFWTGYKIAPKYRAFGFCVTLLPTIVVFGFNVFFFITTNSNYLLDGGKGFGRI